MAAPTHGSNARAWAAVALGAIAAAALPAAIVFARQSTRVRLLDSAWAAPVAGVLGVAALLLARSARARMPLTLGRASGHKRVRAGLILAVTGICFALSGGIAVGFYELLLRLEH